MASRGHAGGLAASSVAAATVLDAAGFQIILLETVGTGQSEVEVAAAADTTVVLEAPEMGDEVQAIKAGLLEVADIVVVNKGDRPGAQRTASELRAMLGAGTGSLPGVRRPEVLLTTATTGEGVADLAAAIARHRAGLDGAAEGMAVRRSRAAALVWSLVGDRVRTRLEAPDLSPASTAVFDAVVRHELDPHAAADRLLALLVAGEASRGR
jgi:LAO/AO transport system kinase